MKPGETIRITCGDCQIVFDLCVAPESEWPEAAPEPMGDIEPTCCPFCGAPAGELKNLHERAIYALHGNP